MKTKEFCAYTLLGIKRRIRAIKAEVYESWFTRGKDVSKKVVYK